MEEVGIEAEKSIQLVEKRKLIFSLITQIANGFSHHDPVLLFDRAVIILFGRTRPSEGDPFFLTVPNQLLVDEFPAVIRIDSQEGEKKLFSDLF